MGHDCSMLNIFIKNPRKEQQCNDLIGRKNIRFVKKTEKNRRFLLKPHKMCAMILM